MLLVVLIVVSRFKFDVLWMTLSFIDVMVIDADTFAFLMMMFPKVRAAAIAAAVLLIPVAVIALADRSVPRPPLACGARRRGLSRRHRRPIGGLSGLTRRGLRRRELRLAFRPHRRRGGVGLLRARLPRTPTRRWSSGCAPTRPATPTGKRPHIILVHDESSFDLRQVNGAKVPPGYGGHFRSFDGKARKFLIEGAGGPSWFTEYNVLSGLSSRSYGRFQFFVTRIAAGRVTRGLPNALKRCGYSTHALYPAFGGFLGTGSYYKGVGIENFIDGKALGSQVFEPDRFYFDAAARLIERERERGPMFVYVYLTANHFTWDYPFREELTPEGWHNPGNAKPEVNEWLRRQAMSERDYAGFLARLKRDFPGEEFLIVRYGDHQPDFAKLIIDPTIDVMGARPAADELRPALLHDLLRDRRASISARPRSARRSRCSTRLICR